jgi:sirohydrochlorin ferrochelatase
MAHGGSEEWNESVREAVAPLASDQPTAIAFGMADPATLQSAVDELESSSVTRIAVVRLFISGESFLSRTEYLFGQGIEPVEKHESSHGPQPGPQRVRTGTEVAIDREGLSDGPEARHILLQRALDLSHDPPSESVLLLGHGAGDELRNQRLLIKMERTADLIRTAGFQVVAAETLQEDWAEARDVAEKRIRRWVSDRSAAGLRVIVVPYRLSGFGPYADVLEGLDYDANGQGLIPHDAVTTWIRRRVQAVVKDAGWSN